MNDMHIHHLCNRESKLFWHDGMIPPSEIWVKLGGDKVGGSFKMNFQIVNIYAPNSVHATCVFSCFEASDSIANLHVALDRFRDEVTEIRNMTWK